VKLSSEYVNQTTLAVSSIPRGCWWALETNHWLNQRRTKNNFECYDTPSGIMVLDTGAGCHRTPLSTFILSASNFHP